MGSPSPRIDENALRLAIVSLNRKRANDPWTGPNGTARPNQLPPDGDWRTWMILAGRGFGKTRTAAEWVRQEIQSGRMKRVALVGATASDVRDVMVQGESGILEVCRRAGFGVTYNPSLRKLSFANDAVAFTYSADEPGRLRGPQHDGAWCLIAGTLILMADGSEKTIDSIVDGDRVMSRAGSMRVSGHASRIKPLVRVRFSDGRTLTGSAEHPIWTQRGWIPLSALTEDDIICSWTDDGDQTTKVTGIATRIGASSIDIELFGKRPMASMFPQVATCITSMASRAMIVLRILRSLLQQSIAPFIQTLPIVAFANSAAASTNTINLAAHPSTVRVVDGALVSDHEIAPNDHASIAASHSRHAEGRIAVNDVSTLGLVGRVYNLRIDGEHEYFANGILTHNSDEIATWRYSESYDQLQFGLRLGLNPRQVATTTPRPIKLVREVMASPSTVVTRGSTYDNRANLAPAFFTQIITRYEGTTLGRQELMGELIEDVEGALWQRALVELHRVQNPERLPALSRIAVAIDPATTFGEDSDETGVAVAGVDSDNHVYVLHGSGHRESPQDWAMRALRLYETYEADEIVAESNQGGEMVRQTIINACRDLPMKPRVRLIHASRGKRVRAEPVVALYEQGKVHHVGMFGTLEDQMMTFPLTEDDDQVDALVHAITAVAPAQRRGLWST